jgi:hypothetical protein
MSISIWLLRGLPTMPPLTMKQTLSFFIWCGDANRFGMCAITIENNVKVQVCIRAWYIHAFVIFLLLSSFVRHDYLLCIVTLTRDIHCIISLGSLNLLTTSRCIVLDLVERICLPNQICFLLDMKLTLYFPRYKFHY